MILGTLALLAIVVAVIVVTGFAVSLVVRDKKSHGTSGSLSAAALEVQSLLEPSKKTTVEEMRRAAESEDEDAWGAPPDKV